MYRAVFLLLFLSTGLLTGQRSGFAPSAGVDIYYETFGEGPPVVLINGGPGFGSEGFREIAQRIAGLGYAVTRFDQRGTGRSRLPGGLADGVSMELMAEDLEALRKALGVDRWTVFGHSFGGMLANFYAARHPGRVRAMVQSSSGGIDLSLLDGAAESLSARLSAAERDSLAVYRRERGAPGQHPEADRKYAGILARAYVYDKTNVPVVAARLLEGNSELNALVWADLRRIGYNEKRRLAELAAPVLIIHGREDIVPVEIARRAHEIYPRSQLVLLERSGHYDWLDRPAAYLAAVDKFLAGVHGG